MSIPGFCGACRTPVPTPDPNADLVGYALPLDAGDGVVTDATVVGTAWGSQYVELATATRRTVRLAAQVRRRKEST